MARTTRTKRKLPAPYTCVSVFDDPPRKNVLLLSCMDQRLLDDTVRFMNELNLQNRYDQVALAGGAMGAHRLPEHQPHPSAAWWEVFTAHLSAAINVLHRPIKDVFLLDHLDCGAYKYLHPDNAIAEEYRNASVTRMRELHADELRALAERVREFCDRQRRLAEAEYETTRVACQDCDEDKAGDGKAMCWERVKKLAEERSEEWTDIRVSYFVMDLCGMVTQLDVPSDQRSTSER